jgi:hypothetical protein
MIGVPLKRLSPARRYQLRQVGCMAAYVVTLPLVIRAFQSGQPAGLLKYLLAVLPALPLVGITLAIGLYLVEETDEFRRLKTTLIVLGGFGITLVVTTVWGFLESFAGVAHTPLWSVFIIFSLSMLVSGPVVGWKYR